MKKKLLFCLVGTVIMTIYAAFRFDTMNDFLTAAISWSIILDIFILFIIHQIDTKNISKGKAGEPDNTIPVSKTDTPHSMSSDNRTISYHKQFKVAGVTFPCKLDKKTNRQDVLERCSENMTYYLSEYEYRNNPAYLVVCKEKGLDIGSAPAGFVDTILKYKDRDTALKCIELNWFENEDEQTIYYAKMQFIVYAE